MRWFQSKRQWSEERERDLAREIESHLRVEAEEQQSAGLAPRDARAAAMKAFGNPALVQEEMRAVWRAPWLDSLLQDLRYGLRGLRRNRGYALVVIVCLTLGIGANTAIFSVLNAVLLRPLPVKDPEQVYALDINETKFRAPQRFSYPLFQEMSGATAHQVAAMSRVSRMYGLWQGESEQEPKRVQLISGEYFPLLGLAPSLGRLLMPEDNQAVGGHPVAVISDAVWAEKFARSPAALGRTIRLNGTTLTIVGVAPAGFTGLWLESPVDLWVPLVMQAAVHYQQNFSSSNSDADRPWLNQDGIRWLEVLVRTREQLPQLNGVFHRWLDRRAETMSDAADKALFLRQHLMLEPAAHGFSNTRSEITAPLYVLAGMVALVLLIACANASNLILARGAARKREIAVRLAIGAGRGRIVRQLITETFLLVVIAAILGVSIANWGATLFARAALGVSSASSPIVAPLDWRVFLFSCAVALATILISGVVPALRATDIDLDAATKSGIRGVSSESFRGPQKLVVAAQIAFVFVLLVAASWFSAGLRHLAHLNLGYDQDQVVTVWLRPELAGYAEGQLPALQQRVVEAVESLPGVQSAAYAMCGLAAGCRPSSSINIQGYQPTPGESMSLQENRVGLNYFSTVGMRLLHGRDFTTTDTAQTTPVAIINEAAVRRYFAGRNPLGQRIGGGTPQIEIVGVVADARVNSEREPAPPMAYYPLPQGTVFGGCIQVRLAGNADGRLWDIQAAIARVEPTLPIDSVRTVRDQVSGNLRRERMTVWLSSVFGALALVLGCFGLYGTMSYAVARRTSEIGIRMALGAQPGGVFRLTFRESLTLIGIGLAVGLPLVIAAARPVSRAIVGSNVTDPWLPVGAAFAITCAAAIAAAVPALRASRVDPLTALRNE